MTRVQLFAMGLLRPIRPDRRIVPGGPAAVPERLFATTAAGE